MTDCLGRSTGGAGRPASDAGVGGRVEVANRRPRKEPRELGRDMPSERSEKTDPLDMSGTRLKQYPTRQNNKGRQRLIHYELTPGSLLASRTARNGKRIRRSHRGILDEVTAFFKSCTGPEGVWICLGRQVDEAERPRSWTDSKTRLHQQSRRALGRSNGQGKPMA